MFNNRKHQLLALVLDIVLYNLIFPFYPQNFNTLNIYQFVLWVIFSYILDKYNFTETKFLFILRRQFICLFFCLFFALLIQKGINILIFNFISFKIQDLIKLTVFSFVINFFLNVYLKPFKKKSKKWIFVGSQDRFNKLQANLEIYNKYFKVFFFNKSYLNSLNKNYYFILDSYSKDIQNSNELKGIKYTNIITLDDWFEKILKRYPSDLISDNMTSKIKKNKTINHFEYKLKSYIEKFIALILLLLFLPIILIALIFVFLEDGHNPIFIQERTGINNMSIKIIKIRTMKYHVSKNNLNWAKNNDSRITRIGSFIRKVRIDELPQLLSVISGDISLIGPRPERPEIDSILEKDIENYRLRYNIKPGLSGWAQVNYPYGASVKDSYNKLSFDFFYMKNYSLLLDLIIFFKTIRLVFNGRGSKPVP